MKFSGRSARRAMLAALGPVVVAGATAGCGTAVAHHGGTGRGGTGRGEVVAYLPIPYQVGSEADTGAARTVQVRVHPGEQFSIKVATSDGPLVWRQVGPAPDGRVVRIVGNFNDGHCAKREVGCRVPYFHVLQARAAGTTVMTWLYRELGCIAARKKMAQPARSCVAAVTFDITVR